MDYKSSGVDIDAGHEVVHRIRTLARSTFTPNVLSDIGSFGGLFALNGAGGEGLVLVASADGVGTKLKVAFLADRHDTVGEDLVNHCVNDILVQGAEPLFFLDYLATGRLAPDVVVQAVHGIARACRANGCALLGGETAEMPGFYADGEYDLAGFIVGAVERSRVIHGRRVAADDVLVGLPSTGLHTNGYSLARRIVFDELKLGIDDTVPELGCTVGEALLQPHRSYLSGMRPLLRHAGLKAMAHITGGGLTDNVPRVLPRGCAARIDRGAWVVPPLFEWLCAAGHVPTHDAYRTFNMGIGLVLVVSPPDVSTLVDELRFNGEPHATVIGVVERGDPSVRYS
jgi:phosphoribosylformylglycinamidine cyclo-ligase